LLNSANKHYHVATPSECLYVFNVEIPKFSICLYDKTGDAGLFMWDSYLNTWAFPLCWHFNRGTSYLNVTITGLHYLIIYTVLQMPVYGV